MTAPGTQRKDGEAERAATCADEAQRRARAVEFVVEDGDLDDDTVTLEIDAGEMGRVYGSRNEVLDEAREIKERLRR
jgi:hypothetical protein